MSLFKPFVFPAASARSYSGRLGEALAGLAERPARLSFSGQAAMEITIIYTLSIEMAKAALFFTPLPPKNKKQTLKNQLKRQGNLFGFSVLEYH